MNSLEEVDQLVDKYINRFTLLREEAIKELIAIHEKSCTSKDPKKCNSAIIKAFLAVVGAESGVTYTPIIIKTVTAEELLKMKKMT